jgi:hypothetical protein
MPKRTASEVVLVETDKDLDYDADGWHWTTDAAHYNPDDIPSI